MRVSSKSRSGPQKAVRSEPAFFMECSIAFGRATESSLMTDQDEIASYEGLLKSIPQIQIVSNDDVSSSWSSFGILMSVYLSIYFISFS